MGKRGQPKQPTALKIARGNPGKRPLNELEPEFEAPTMAEPPADLAGAGLAEWHDQLPRLIGAGVLTAADMAGFTSYCRFVSLEERYAKRLAGLTDAEEDVEAVDRVVNQMHKISGPLARWAQHYGITPSSRSGVKAKKPATAADTNRKRFLSIDGNGTAHSA